MLKGLKLEKDSTELAGSHCIQDQEGLGHKLGKVGMAHPNTQLTWTLN